MAVNVDRKKTLLDTEATEVLASAPVFKFPDIEVYLHNVNDDIKLHHVTNIHYSRNFNTNLTDIVFVEFLYPLGSFKKDIFDLKDELEMTIIITTANKDMYLRRYKFILMSKFPEAANSNHDAHDDAALDTQQTVTVKGQCLDPLTLQLKQKYVSGIYHGVKIDQFLKAIFAKKMSDIKVLGYNVDFTFNIYRPDNQNTINNLHIKPYTKLIKLPYEIQNTDYGIYNGGVNIYFSNFSTKQTNHYDMYIYPLYEYDRFDNEQDLPRLIIFNPPKQNYDKNEHDLLYENGFYKVVTNNVEFKSETEETRYNEGNGLAYVNIEEALDPNNLVFDDNDKIMFANNTVFDSEDFDLEDRSFFNLINASHDNNLYRYKSKLNKQKGILGIITLAKINPEVLYPGMPFKYIFMKNKKVVETTGIIQGVEFYYDLINKTIVSKIMGMFKKLDKEEVKEIK